MVMCKEYSKLWTFWQINDYLSKKIDYQLIVDIIDTPGHPDHKQRKEGVPNWVSGKA